MAKTSSRDRMKNEINAGSMADIAFLAIDILSSLQLQLQKIKGYW